MREPSGLLLVVGPDGAGKTTVVDAIASRVGLPVRRAHHRPGVLARRGAEGPVTDPHAKPPRGLVASLAKLGVVLADHVIGGHLMWRAQRRAGLLVLERGWFDMAVDPRRYRLPVAIVPLVRMLGNLVPHADVALLLTGDAEELHARKPEIGAAEVRRQIERWRRQAHTAARTVVEIDTIRTAPGAAAQAALDALSGSSWRSVPCTPRRVELRRTGRARPALAVYQPQSLRARLGATASYRWVTLPGRRVAAPLPRLDELWRLLGLHPDGVASMRSSTPGRLVLGTSRGRRMEVVVKIGGAADAGLRNEAEMLSADFRTDLPISRPILVWSGEWCGRFVLATRAVDRAAAGGWTPDEVVPLAEALAEAGPEGRAVTHGDLTPWNLVRSTSGPVLLDWESARWVDEPLHDLAHFVVQGGALLGRYSPERAVALLCDARSPGTRLLEVRGLDADAARPLLGRYLAQARPTEVRAVRFRDEMMKLVGA
jgi:hypothetical protein